jgi:hypothetical protein
VRLHLFIVPRSFSTSLDSFEWFTERMVVMRLIPYDDSAHMFRRYKDWEIEEETGYPFIWEKISAIRRAERLYRCADCGFAYLEEGDLLTVHHSNFNKADCRRENLNVYCWLCHSLDHEPDSNQRDWKCKFCKGHFLGWGRLHRHIRGIHRAFELKIPEITLDRPPRSFVARRGTWSAIQQERLWWD